MMPNGQLYSGDQLVDLQISEDEHGQYYMSGAPIHAFATIRCITDTDWITLVMVWVEDDDPDLMARLPAMYECGPKPWHFPSKERAVNFARSWAHAEDIPILLFD